MRGRTDATRKGSRSLRFAGIVLVSFALGMTLPSCDDWDEIDHIPSGFADGVDNDTPTTAGAGLDQNGNQLSVDFEGSGSGLGVEDTVARSDHDHDSIYVLNAGDTMTGDLVLDTDGASGTVTAVSESGIERSSAVAETFNIENSGAGTMTLQVDGSAVLTAADTGHGQGLNADLLDGKEATAFWQLGGNAGTAAGADFVGTTDDQPLELHVNGVRVLKLIPETDSPSILGGHPENYIEPGAYASTIAGGGVTSEANRAYDSFGTIGGGRWNQVGVDDGGTGTQMYGTVGGGYGNYALNIGATVAGGITNFASGNFAAVPGGHENSASGDYSLAAGRRAKATHNGAFVWADATDADFASAVVNEFAVRATGGVRLTVDAAGGGLRLEPDATSANVIGGYSGNSVTAGVYGATIGGGGIAADANSVTDNFSTVGGGQGNRAGDADGGSDPASAPYATVGGGQSNTADASWATVGGGRDNTAGFYATVGGGLTNSASNQFATIGGGRTNTIGGDYATIAGGQDNIASGGHATVGGGQDNIASGTWRATVAGGYLNAASGSYATVGGGISNDAGGTWATVPGGSGNIATGNYSFAAGYRASATHLGAFVWSDYNFDLEFPSTAARQFSVRCTGGARFVTAIDGGTGAPTAGVSLAPAATSWGTISDRNRKKAFRPVEGEDILRKLARLEIATWNYVWEKEGSVRHMGPMAQDFHAAFGLGKDEKVITTQEADGVALAAAKALERRTAELTKENAELRARLAAVEAALKDLAGR